MQDSPPFQPNPRRAILEISRKICRYPDWNINRYKKCVVHVPRNSTEKCKYLQSYSKKYIYQHPHDKSCGITSKSNKRSKTLHWKSVTKETPIITKNSIYYLLKNEKGKVIQTKKYDPEDSWSEDEGSGNGIEFLKIVGPTNDLGSDTEWKTTQRRGITSNLNIDRKSISIK